MSQFWEFVANHWVLFTALVLILALLAANLLSGLRWAGVRLEPAEAVRLMNRDGAVVIDLREAAEFDRGHILNAVNIPQARLTERLAELQKYRERPIILCCGSDAAAGSARSALAQAGFTKLYALHGGMAAWRQENLPVARGRKAEQQLKVGV